MANKQYIYISRIVDGQKTQERYSRKAAIKAYDAKLVARFLENQRHRVSANVIAAAKRDAAAEQNAQDEKLSGAVDQNIRRQSGSRRFGDLKEVDASSKTGLIRYLNKIEQFPRLERQEEYELAKSWREHGDYSARDKLITSHLRLVVSIADDNRRYRRSKESLISEGTVGLIEAVDLFDPEKGFPTVGLRQVADQGSDLELRHVFLVAGEDRYHGRPEKVVLQPAEREESYWHTSRWRSGGRRGQTDCRAPGREGGRSR